MARPEGRRGGQMCLDGPRDPIDPHAPGGCALGVAAARAIDLLNRKAGGSGEEVAEWFLHIWREVLIRSNFDAGCAVLAVTIATDSPDLREHAASIFRSWRLRLAELLENGGLGAPQAARYSAAPIPTSEGAASLSRAAQSPEPLHPAPPPR